MSPGKLGTGHDHGGLRAHPTTKWRCDGCGQWMEIISVVVLIDSIRGQLTSHRLINKQHTLCLHGRDVEIIWPGIQLIGVDGLAMLLGWLSGGSHDPSSVAALIWRFHIPRFETVHPWFQERYDGRPLSDPNAFMCMQEDLDAMIRTLDAAGWPPPAVRGRYLLKGATPAKARVRRAPDL